MCVRKSQIWSVENTGVGLSLLEGIWWRGEQVWRGKMESKCISFRYLKQQKRRITAHKPAGPPHLVMSSSAAWEHSCIWDTSSVARSTACWMYRWVRRTALPESHFCLSSHDFRVLSKAYLKLILQWTVKSSEAQIILYLDIIWMTLKLLLLFS